MIPVSLQDFFFLKRTKIFVCITTLFRKISIGYGIFYIVGAIVGGLSKFSWLIGHKFVENWFVNCGKMWDVCMYTVCCTLYVLSWHLRVICYSFVFIGRAESWSLRACFFMVWDMVLVSGSAGKGDGRGLRACFFMGWVVVLVSGSPGEGDGWGFRACFLMGWAVVPVSGSPDEGDWRDHGSGVQPQNQGHRHHGAPGQGQSSLLSHHTYPTQVMSRLFWLVIMFL